jgi:2-(1,2-epoxy-1,2-dihydrophenyl)acetyl-CoA isomerase
MLACDLAIAADDARFTSAYSRIGASPDGGSTFFLTRALGSRKALELTLLSEPVDAATALALGLVNRLASPERLRDETRALAARLAAGPTVAYAEAKRLVGSAIDNSLEQQLEAEAHAFSRCTRTDDLREGVTAFARKRPAMFRGK